MKITKNNYTPIQLKLPVDYEKIIDINDPVYSFVEVLNHIDLKKFIVEKDYSTGRHGYDSEKLLMIILFAFMEYGYVSLREIEKFCKTDIRFMWILDDMKVPSYVSIGNFINNNLKCTIEEILTEINEYIFDANDVDLNHVYIDGSKIEANSNKYTWVWKKSCIRSRDKLFLKITELLNSINEDIMKYYRVQFEIREKYAIEYLEFVKENYLKLNELNPQNFVYGRGKRKTTEQRYYDILIEYTDKLKCYGKHIKICGDYRNSYSKTDHDATFMRVKKDYMGNDQLLPAYNFQLAICDGYVAMFRAICVYLARK